MKVLLLSRVMRCIERNLAIFITFLLHMFYHLHLRFEDRSIFFSFIINLLKLSYLYMKAIKRMREIEEYTYYFDVILRIRNGTIVIQFYNHRSCLYSIYISIIKIIILIMFFLSWKISRKQIYEIVALL